VQSQKCHSPEKKTKTSNSFFPSKQQNKNKNLLFWKNNRFHFETHTDLKTEEGPLVRLKTLLI